jgi:RimJ/RimL family protein N-acetyltransferase
MDVELRAVEAGDLELLGRCVGDPEAAGRNWAGFRDVGAIARRFGEDGYLGTDNSWLIITAGGEAAGFVSWTRAGHNPGPYWLIGIIVLPRWRGQGVGSAAQALLADYLFTHTPVRRIAAETQPDNLAEQRALDKAGFTLDGVLRAAEYRDGGYQDVVVYSRLRGEPPRA